MSDNSVDSTIEEEERINHDAGPNGIAQRLKALFCCFRRESNVREIIDKYDPDEYDYIVEKLVVKRVPLALFAIPADLANRRRLDDASLMPDDISQSSSLSTFGGNNPTITRGTYLTSMRMDRTVYDSAANKALRSNTNKNQDLSCQAKSSVWKQGIPNQFNALHPNLREFEKPSKNPPNFPRSKLSFAEDISVASSTRTDISSRTPTSSVIGQDDVSIQDNSVRHESIIKSEINDKSKKEDISRQAQNPSTVKDQGKFILGRNRKYIVSPFQVKRGSLDLTKPKNIVENFGVDGKSLVYIEESAEEKSSELAEDSKDCNLQSNTAVRWRITIRRRRANAEKGKCIGEDISLYISSAVVHLLLYSFRTCGRCRGNERGIIMAAIEIFSSSVTYKYKSRIYSCASIVVFMFIVLSLLTPLFIIYNAGGIWMRNRMHAETPDVHFEYKYLLLAEVDPYEQPIVCSTFTTYKENEIKDHCTLIKIRENDLNGDGQKDSLKFEAYFYTDKPVKSLRLLLFFNFQLKHLIQATIESIGVFDQVLSHEVQEIRFFGDLELRQKGLLRSEGLYETYNHSVELSDYSLSELLLHNFNRKFSARITNERVTWRSGFSSDEAVAVIGELFYVENFIHYQPSVWEELKWAWIQYVSCLLVFAYVAKHILVFLFTNRYLNTYIVRPWANIYINK